MKEVSVEEENKVIDAYSHKEFFAIMRKEFGVVGVVTVLGYATLFGLTGKQTATEARKTLVAWGWASSTVYEMFQDFRRLRRALLANRDIVMLEQRGGPGMNDSVPGLVSKLLALRSP